MPSKVKIKDILKQLNIKKLKPKQKEIINLFLKKDKRDTIAILPTGYGKSLCYVVPHLIKKKNVIVISPLISLMEDQAKNLSEKGINTLIFNSNNHPFSSYNGGQPKFSNVLRGVDSYIMYFSPESFLTNSFNIKCMIEYNRVSMIAIDECHCVSIWSEFRTDYTKLHQIKEWVKQYNRKIYLLGLTATATEDMIDDISEKLNFQETLVVRESLYRDNLKININLKSSMTNDVFMMKNYIDKLKLGSKCIVYCKTRKDTEAISEKLKKYKIECSHYHAGLSSVERTKIQTDFRDNKLKAICATIAFGMGIDDKNIHLIIHYGISKNIESYYQEIGRGGRNGGEVDCYVFWNGRDFSTNHYFISKLEEAENRIYESRKLKQLRKFIDTGDCRMKYICNYFGDKNVGKCGKCDNCNPKHDILDLCGVKRGGSVLCRYMVIDTVQKIKNGIGISTLSMILQGSRNKKIDPFMKSLNSYGKYGHLKISKIKDNVKEIQKDGLIREHNVQYGWGTYFKVSDKGKKWYYNEGKNVKKAMKKIGEFVDLVKFKLSLSKFGFGNLSKNIKPKQNYKQLLLDWRKKKALETNLPQYCILKNNVIDNIVLKMPKNTRELNDVKGIGKKIIEKYGKEIMNIIS